VADVAGVRVRDHPGDHLPEDVVEALGDELRVGHVVDRHVVVARVDKGVVVHTDLVDQATTGAGPVDDQDVGRAVGRRRRCAGQGDVTVRGGDGGVDRTPGAGDPQQHLELVARAGSAR